MVVLGWGCPECVGDGCTGEEVGLELGFGLDRRHFWQDLHCSCRVYHKQHVSQLLP